MSNEPDDPTVYVENTEPDAHKRKPPAGIQGWGADLDPAVRPGYPMERTPPRFIHPPATMEHQKPSVKVFHSTERPGLTPVFGTAQPPTGVSGMIRAAAYHQSENDIRHWLMLLLADRVNMVEGIIEDLAHGHVPNVFKEMGGPAEWRHNRNGFIRKAFIAGAVVGALVYMKGRRRRRIE
jgi:hypothetical protein